MSGLKIDAHVYSRDESKTMSREVIELAQKAEEMGFDGVPTHETDCNPFLPVPLLAEHTTDIQISTRIATAFTRSPMVLAYTAWDLARYSNGRFALGLGTQVKGHNEHRFDVESQPPGPRFRDVLQALRHIFDVFQGEEDDLDYDGEFYSFSLMPPFFKPEPIENPDIPIYIAGVNEYNLKLAGELADGLVMHGFNTPKYTEEVIIPNVKEGCERANRSFDDVELIAGPMTITGRNDEEMKKSRENTRGQIAFYGSTRSYHDVWEAHGLKGLGEELHELSKQDEWKQMREIVTDDVVDEFAVEAPIEEVGKAVRKTYGDKADRVSVGHEFDGEPYWEHIVDDIHG